ncbi:MAG: hypothetical protein CMQ49_00070 [Gammaproteobacteria bacterium]|mgnify:FL=1|nr:hypothetical protein [Gammaproteobacteria bacterium]
MIAPAMKTRPDQPLAYRELARRRAAVTRRLGPSSLPRWSALAGENWSVDTQLEFSLDEDGVAWVHGEFAARAELRCQRCLEVLPSEYSGRVDLCLVEDAQRADELAHSCDVLLVSGDQIDVSEIVEDELLLGVPEQLCEQEPCVRLPDLSYPAPGVEEEEVQDNPFAALGRLKAD